MTHTQAKYQGQRSAVSKARVETDGWTDMTDYIIFPSKNTAVNTKQQLLK